MLYEVITKLIATETTRITDIYTRPILDKNGSATVEVELELTNDAFTAQNIEAHIKLTGKNFQSKENTATITQLLKPGVNKIVITSYSIHYTKLYDRPGPAVPEVFP